MARKSFKLSQYSNMLLNVIFYSIFNEFAFAFPSYRESRQSESLEKLTSAPNVQQVRCRLPSVSLFSISVHTYCPRSVVSQVRLHFGVIASIVIVVVAAIAAAVFIIRKYCCLQRYICNMCFIWHWQHNLNWHFWCRKTSLQ